MEIECSEFAIGIIRNMGWIRRAVGSFPGDRLTASPGDAGSLAVLRPGS